MIRVSALANSSAVSIGEGLLLRPCIDPRFPEFGVLPESTFTAFSNYGPEVDIAAPGCNVATTLPTYREFWEHWLKDTRRGSTGNKNHLAPANYVPYSFGNGTRIATPMVTAGVALWISKYRSAYESTPPRDRLRLVLRGNGSVPGLLDLAEHIAPGTCEDPSETGCAHFNYKLGPDGRPVWPPVHPEPVLDVSTLLEF